ncbi:3097_t:CDS:2 [Dentiscutata erythropus]|uniref:3097_t:CDS:1 n=1 Tax=Dentiscutata erythropus TaxID=1348616 RepID=A0A9N9CYW7_9GLOM|nr:3097_t:CDS:2 [Dentiscutata erythropus]
MSNLRLKFDSGKTDLQHQITTLQGQVSGETDIKDKAVTIFNNLDIILSQG